MDKVTLDFETNMIEWDTDGQKGTEFCPDLAQRKISILAAMGYELFKSSDIADVVNGFINGKITDDDMMMKFNKITE